MKQQEKLVPELRFGGFEGEWEMKKLGEVSSLITKGTTPSNFANTGIKFIKIECFETDGINQSKCLYIDNSTHEKELKRSILKENDILFAIAGATIGKVNIVQKAILPANTNQALAIIRLREMENLYFVFQVLRSSRMQKYITDSISVGAQPNLNLEQMNNFQYFAPTLPEQQKIAAFLTAVDTRIQALKKQKALFETYKKGVMQQLFSQELRFKDENGGEFEAWEEKRLGEVAKKKILKNKDNRITNVLTNSAKLGIVSQRDFFERDIANQDNLDGYYVVCEDDFVYNPRISSTAPVGPISRSRIKEGVMSPLYSVFKFELGILTYFEYFFESTFWHNHMKDISNYGARADRMSFSIDDFYKMPIPYPSLPEQVRIANFLTALDEKIKAAQSQISLTEQWKKGLLHRMFV